MKINFKFRLAAIAIFCFVVSGIRSEPAMGNAKSIAMPGTKTLSRTSTISAVKALPVYPFEYFLIKI